eukprot:2847612-Amphidinium_carterae.1
MDYSQHRRRSCFALGDQEVPQRDVIPVMRRTAGIAAGCCAEHSDFDQQEMSSTPAIAWLGLPDTGVGSSGAVCGVQAMHIR